MSRVTGLLGVDLGSKGKQERPDTSDTDALASA